MAAKLLAVALAIVGTFALGATQAKTQAQAAAVPAVTPATQPALALDAPDPDVVYTNGAYYAFTTGTTWGNEIGIATTASADPTSGWGTLSGGPFGSSAFSSNPAASWQTANSATSPGVFELGGHWIMFYDALDAAGSHYCISVATSATVTGPYVDSSGGPLVCQLSLGGSIDPQPFVDPASGQPYLMWKSNDGSSASASTVWSQPLGPDGTVLSGSPTAIFQIASASYPFETTTDDPSMVDAGGTYYLFMSGGNYQSGYYPTYYVNCAGPVGPCDQSEAADPILVTSGGSGGGMVFQGAGGGWWLTYQSWSPPSCTNYSCGGSRFMYVAPISLPSAAVPPGPGLPVDRIYGTDAIATSIAVSQAEFPTDGSANAVVLARSDFFTDALAGGPLAAKEGGPMLITPPASQSATLDPRVLSEIQRVLRPGGAVYVLGGDLALSPGIDSQLGALGYEVMREAGTDEYDTAVKIAQALGNPPIVFEATGLSFADALSSVPAAIQQDGAILLTDGSTQAPETAGYLAQHPGDTRYAVGGPLAALGADPRATGVYGADLYGTSAAVATRFFGSATTFGAATGLGFPDALSGGVFMGIAPREGPVLLVNPSLPLPSPIADYLGGDPALKSGYLFGGPLAVGGDVAAAL
ncbi:MAG: cell wall-binding repeat-containing protein [Acidimicrobiales bacterium]